MENDIDIEEHNLLENPALKKIFPDITVLKQELLDFENEASSSLNLPRENTDIENCFITGKDPNFGNESTFEPYISPLIPDQNIFIGNKIILGSKPKKNNLQQNLDSIEITNRRAKIVLSDIKSLLICSKKFCNRCNILFPNEDMLTNHHKAVHNSILKQHSRKAVENMINPKNSEPKKNFCLICKVSFANKSNWYRHIKNIHKNKYNKSCPKIVKESIKNVHHKVNPNNETNSLDSNASCFHCSDTFSTKQSLIEHLYAILEAKKGKNKNKDIITETGHTDTSVTGKSIEKIKQGDINQINEIGHDNMKKIVKISLKTKTEAVFLQCAVCFCYFRDEKYYTKHMINKHRVNNILKKKVIFSNNCKICSKFCPDSKSYNKHIYNKHRQYLSKRVIKIQNVLNKSKFDVKTGDLYQYNEKNVPNRENAIQNIILPQSVIFKCNQCDINFISSKLALNHIEHREILINWKCEKCNFVFKRTDSLFHIEQHLYSDSFKLVEICEDSYTKILFNCPKCSIHFDEDCFKEHYFKCNENICQSIHCTKCDILIDIKLKISHEETHKSGMSNMNDFIFIDIVKERTTHSNFHNQETKLSNKKPKVVIKRNLMKVKTNWYKSTKSLHLNYCDSCKCFISRLYKVDCHKQAKCTKMIRYVCRYCGLVFTNKAINAHRKLHIENKNLKLQNFTFYDLTSGKKIKPPIPIFPQCEGCQKHFIYKTDLRSHMCGEEVENVCEFCHIKLNDKAYKLHVPFHKYNILTAATKKKKGTDISENLEHCEQTMSDTLKENKRTSLTPDFFLCKVCGFYVESYDRVVEHCHQHLKHGRTKYKPIFTEAENCELCNIQIEKQSYDSHKKLHDNSIVPLKMFSFDIFYFGLKNEEWLKHVYGSTFHKDLENNLIDSVYKHENRIKLTINKDGDPKLTMFRCEKCKLFMECRGLFEHVQCCVQESSKNTLKFMCKLCELPFISSVTLGNHILHIHSQYVATKNLYRIVSFNCKEDEEINDMIKLHKSTPYVLYKCRNCEGLVKNNCLITHICNVNDLQRCSYCGLLVYKTDTEIHKRKHKEFDSFTESNIKVVLVGYKLNSGNVVCITKCTFKGIVCDYSFYKCAKCEVCIRDFRCISKHFCMVPSGRVKCPKCDLNFEEGRLKSHLKQHLSDPEFVKENIITIEFNGSENSFVSETDTNKIESSTSQNKQKQIESKTSDHTNDKFGTEEKFADIYKCVKCGLNFFKRSSLQEHFKKGPSKPCAPQNCSKCGLMFSPNLLFKHILEHHGNKDIVYKFKVIEVTGKFKKHMLYKCPKCNLHFESKKHLNHYSECIGDSSKGGKPRCCDFMFHTSSLSNHESIHENNVHVDFSIAIINENVME